MGIRGQRHAPAASAPGKRYDTRCTGSWLGLGIGLDGYRKCRPHRVSNLGSSSPVASCYKEYVISATFPTTNPLWTDLESNPGLPLSEAGEQPYEPWHCPSRMSHGTAPTVHHMMSYEIWYDVYWVSSLHTVRRAAHDAESLYYGAQSPPYKQFKRVRKIAKSDY